MHLPRAVHRLFRHRCAHCALPPLPQLGLVLRIDSVQLRLCHTHSACASMRVGALACACACVSVRVHACRCAALRFDQTERQLCVTGASASASYCPGFHLREASVRCDGGMSAARGEGSAVGGVSPGAGVVQPTRIRAGVRSASRVGANPGSSADLARPCRGNGLCRPSMKGVCCSAMNPCAKCESERSQRRLLRSVLKHSP